MRPRLGRFIVILLLIVWPIYEIARDCTTNRLVLANYSDKDIVATVTVQDQGKRIWSGSLRRASDVYVPFEIDHGEGHFEVEVWDAVDRSVSRSEHGYLFPFDGATHVLTVSDRGVYATWQAGFGVPWGWWQLAVHIWRFLTDHMSCADEWAWRAITD